jgi:hypothetical protein
MHPKVCQQCPRLVQAGRPRSGQGQTLAEYCVSRLIPGYDQQDLEQEQGKKAKGIEQEDLHEAIFGPLKVGLYKAEKLAHHGKFSIPGIYVSTTDETNLRKILDFFAALSPGH